MRNDPGFKAAEARRSQLAAIHENSARYASSYVSFSTHGWGDFISPDCQRFTTTFVKRPSVSHGVTVDGDKLIAGRFPRVTAGVHKWLQDSDGFFIGAWLFFVIETMGLEFCRTYAQPQADGKVVGLANVLLPTDTGYLADPEYDLIHDFTFTGIAMKAIPAHLLENG